MGAPKKELRPFAVGEMAAALQLVRESAKNFDQRTARVVVLERLRVLLQPMTEWLDVSTSDWLKVRQVRGPKRVLPLFGNFGSLCQIGLTRNGSWVAMTWGEGRIDPASSEEIVDAVSDARFYILNYPRASMQPIEAMADMQPAVEHGAFLKYLVFGLKGIDDILKEREERLRTIRNNLSFLQSFAEGADPLAHGKAMPFPGYSVFCHTDHGHSRCSGTYLVQKTVEETVRAKNKALEESAHEYFVSDDSYQPRNLDDVLFRLRVLANGTRERGICGRGPFSDEEATLLRTYMNGLRLIPDAWTTE